MKTKNFDSKEYLELMDKYWRATNYISATQLYLMDNPLILRPLVKDDIKKKIVGHWGTVPGQNFIYTHLNRIINKYNQKMLYISGPGHGGNFFVSNAYLEGTYSEVYPNITQNIDGLKKLNKQFSFPCGISSHVAPEVPGSIHEGGELGYSLAHGYGAVFDNPDLIVAVVVGDGEAETGPLATAWHSNKFINPKRDGAVLPILHLNGYKISNPTIFSRMTHKEIENFFKGCGYEPIFVEGSEPKLMHKLMANALDTAYAKIKKIQDNARNKDKVDNYNYPMIIFRTPKGWTGPKFVDGKQVEGTFNAHQVPLSMNGENHLQLLQDWLLSYKPLELFNENGQLKEELKALCPRGEYRMSATPYSNGGKLLKELKLPKLNKYGVKMSSHGEKKAQDMLELSAYLRDVFVLNEKEQNFRIFSPDEAKSNRLYAPFEVTKRIFNSQILPNDEDLSRDGRIVDSYLSEHMCEGWLEGYILTGRHGIFASYEAFIRVVDSMVSQHIKWLKICNEIEWRKPISSLNLILTSNVWQQDHNGFTHQDPGMLDHIVDKKGNVVRAYLPPDANCLINVIDHCLQSKNYVNIIVASKHPSFQWLSVAEAKTHCENGVGIFEWASFNDDGQPDIVLACCGDTPTLEMLACAKYLHENLPNLKIRFINVVDLMKLENANNHPHGLSDENFNELFTTNTPIIFAYHGYPKLIHELCYKRQNNNLHVAGYREEGAITTAFDMRVLNKIDRFNLAIMALNNLKNVTKVKKNKMIEELNQLLIDHKNYIKENGIDMPIITEWKW